MHKVIGLTGATGSGKSTAALTAKAWGCYVIDADQVAREALAKGSACLKALAEVFGQDILNEDGTCRRRVLAQRAFADKQQTERLNRLTHPWIIRRIEEYIEVYRQKGDGWILLDAPLLYESGGDRLCDKVIAMTAPQEIRLERIQQRDGLTREEALQRMRAQPEDTFYTSRADAVIDGSQPLAVVQHTVQAWLDRWKTANGADKD